MTALERLGRTRRTLAIVMVLRALLLGAAAAVSILLVVAAADYLIGVTRPVREVARILAIASGVVVAVAALVPVRRLGDAARVALWIEEQVPSLRYALVTLAAAPASAHATAFERRVASVTWEPLTRRILLRRLAMPAIVLLAALTALVVLPSSTLARVAAPAVGDALSSRAIADDARRSTIETLVAAVTPPAYTGERRRTIEEPSLIAAPAGSRLELRGRGAAARVAADIGGTALRAVADGDRWVIAVTVAGRPFAIRLRDSVAADERIVAVEPRADGVPRVTLESPARDSVLRTPAGRVSLVAEAVDDYGLASLRFEWIVSAGEGENFTFRSGAAAFTGGNGRSRRITASLALDSLALTPGSMVHVRAVARDANSVTGPGQGVSETRILRIARAGEYDSVAVEAAAPPEGDSSALSQRMLIQMTEALEKRRPRIGRSTLLWEATAIARDQIRLRKRVGEIIFQRLSGEDSGEHSHEDLSPEELMAHAAAEGGMGPPAHGDETPILAINQPLLEAYNAMWEAQTALQLGELREALPPMYSALAAIQRARAAERLYLRGRPSEIVIDLGKVRLAGQRPEAAGARTPRAAPTAELALEQRFARALALAARDAGAAADSLTLLRLAVIGDGADARPTLAAALADAASRLRGKDAAAAEAALRNARRALAGEPRSTPGLPAW